MLVAKQYDFIDERLKKSCKRHLDPSIALSFYNDVRKYAFEPPGFGIYLKSLMNFVGLSLILRFVDAVTDISLTCQYFSMCIELENGTVLYQDCQFQEMNWLIPGRILGTRIIKNYSTKKLLIEDCEIYFQELCAS